MDHSGIETLEYSTTGSWGGEEVEVTGVIDGNQTFEAVAQEMAMKNEKQVGHQVTFEFTVEKSSTLQTALDTNIDTGLYWKITWADGDTTTTDELMTYTYQPERAGKAGEPAKIVIKATKFTKDLTDLITEA